MRSWRTAEPLPYAEVTPNLTADDAGLITTTSLDVAAKFGKRHNDVLKAIRKLGCSADFRSANFCAFLTALPMPRGRGMRETEAFRMTRDGFCFLVMGFTGKKAAEWKERYIAAPGGATLLHAVPKCGEGVIIMFVRYAGIPGSSKPVIAAPFKIGRDKRIKVDIRRF
jgi:Rha family phage regulatory protein